ncbi:hypothetical protein DPMN_179297 [Dreissena polymorpha]|uniref:Uncharacterized protein n=1 Tax=Dreissena polymorpha TaxID=45954 RepID=A0A9D4EC52_DREPO|nr:hypothetical protein DPMN_179297 [Dreissena polymorpha]
MVKLLLKVTAKTTPPEILYTGVAGKILLNVMKSFFSNMYLLTVNNFLTILNITPIANRNLKKMEARAREAIKKISTASSNNAAIDAYEKEMELVEVNNFLTILNITPIANRNLKKMEARAREAIKKISTASSNNAAIDAYEKDME